MIQLFRIFIISFLPIIDILYVLQTMKSGLISCLHLTLYITHKSMTSFYLIELKLILERLPDQSHSLL